jgi:hypothetical protein
MRSSLFKNGNLLRQPKKTTLKDYSHFLDFP